MLDGKPELTPVAIQAGLLLARRMCGVSEMKVKKSLTVILVNINITNAIQWAICN